VIYRELFPFGLTVADLGPSVRPVEVSLVHIAARQELRQLMLELGLEEEEAEAPAAPDTDAPPTKAVA
jgi:chromosome partitioning protein